MARVLHLSCFGVERGDEKNGCATVSLRSISKKIQSCLKKTNKRREHALLRACFSDCCLDRRLPGIWRRCDRGSGNCQSPVLYFSGDVPGHAGYAFLENPER